LRRLAQHMGTHRPFIGLRQANAPLNESIEEMAARYVLAMRKLQVMGPYYLGGHSFGATVAYEMARQLAEQGHEIGLLAIMDQRRPSWRMTMRQAVPVMHRILANLPSIIRAEAAQAPPGEKVKSLSRMIMRWSKSIVGAPIDTSLKFDLRHADATLVSLLEANLRAIRRYQPKSSPVPIWLFRARTPVPSNLALDSTLGWSGLTRGGVRVSIVPGAHGSITAEPFVRTLAKSVSDALDVAQEHNCKLQ
jgi:thioesterase domain-containing protein